MRASSKLDWKGCPPRVSEVGVIDSNEELRYQIVHWIEDLYPRLEVRGLADIFRAYRGLGRFDYLFINETEVEPDCDPFTIYVHRYGTPIYFYHSLVQVDSLVTELIKPGDCEWTHLKKQLHSVAV